MVTSISVALSITVSTLVRYRLAEVAHLGVATARDGPRRGDEDPDRWAMTAAAYQKVLSNQS